jgi:stringent starvation protein B
MTVLSDTDSLSSMKPYLLRAHHEWMVDNGLTPHLIVDASARGVSVPMDYVEDGSIVLNVAPRAVSGLDIGNESLSFSARFNGVGTQVFVPISAVRGLVAREFGVGVSFPEVAEELEGEVENEDTQSRDDEAGAQTASRPGLRLVK